jgi:3-oxoacyl-[acyl-carrier protein] reductase
MVKRMNPMSLQNRTTIVTGAGQGIGRAVSMLALDLGANLVAVDRNKEGVESIVAETGADRVLAIV